MTKSIFLILGAIGFASCITSCKTKVNQESSNAPKVIVPAFNADSAYYYTKKQVDFGPRVPNTAKHDECGAWLTAQLKRFGAKVYEQKTTVTAYDGTQLKIKNIIGAYKPDTHKRVLLFAHWDTRPWADQDPDPSKHHTPILGANDGASGVAVLLEIARQIQKKSPEVGIDIAFFDAEDYGTPQWASKKDDENSWCLGTQYWAENPHVDDYTARFSILLDMVGGKSATFQQEGFSKETSASFVNKIWNQADKLGYSSFFTNSDGGYITDDHVFVNKIAKIPSVDIIQTNQQSTNGAFASYWHTLSDNMDSVDKQTLKVVGETVMSVIYNEK
jgi:Zn-dependent M28 family amino/carboxypeptidase